MVSGMSSDETNGAAMRFEDKIAIVTASLSAGGALLPAGILSSHE
jgi:hypothetical protein